MTERTGIVLARTARYVLLNPLRVGLVPSAGEFSWGSYQAVVVKTPAPDWLAVYDILAMFPPQRGPARRAYARFVTDGIGAADPHEEIQRACILSSEEFMERVLDQVDRPTLSPEIVRKDRSAHSLEAVAARNQTRDAAIQETFATDAYTINELAELFGMHRATASRIARRQHRVSRLFRVLCTLHNLTPADPARKCLGYLSPHEVLHDTQLQPSVAPRR